jgi:hypothetical protein
VCLAIVTCEVGLGGWGAPCAQLCLCWLAARCLPRYRRESVLTATTDFIHALMHHQVVVPGTYTPHTND